MNYRVTRIIVCSSNKSDLFDVRSLKTTKYVARKDPFERTNSHVRGRRFTSSCPRHGVISLSSEWEPKEGTQQQWRRDLGGSQQRMPNCPLAKEYTSCFNRK